MSFQNGSPKGQLGGLAMMASVLAIVILVLPISAKDTNTAAGHKPTQQASSTSRGYGKTRWGMSTSQVKELYPEAHLHQGQLFLLDQHIGADAASIVFKFTEQKLTSVWVKMEETYVNDNNYVDEYGRLKELLTKKYGVPSEDHQHWSSNLYRDNPDHVGMAVASGQLRLGSSWETQSTSIKLVCSGENFKSSVIAWYTSKEFASSEQQNEEKADLSNL